MEYLIGSTNCSFRIEKVLNLIYNPCIFLGDPTLNVIPTYLLKRIVPPRAAKIRGGNIEVTLINVLAPFVIYHFADENFSQFLDIVVDGKILRTEEKQHVGDLLEIHIGHDVIKLGDVRAHDGLELPLGTVVKFIMPNIWNWQTGETHKITVRVHDESPIEATVERQLG